MDIDGLARHAILLGEAGNAFSESETRVDSLYLFLRQRRLPAAPIVGITLSGEEDSLALSLFYHLAFKLGYRAENVEIQGLARIGVTVVKLHSFLVEDDFYASGKQFLHEVEQIAERTCQAIYAVDVERVAVTEIGETLRQGRTIAYAIAREPPSLRTGRVLTGGAPRRVLLPRGTHLQSRPRAAFAILGRPVRPLEVFLCPTVGHIFELEVFP